MEELASVNHQSYLTCFKAYCKAHLRAKGQLGTLHKVEHYVFKVRHESFLVDYVKVNFFEGCYLDPDVALLERYLSSHIVDCVVYLPRPNIFFFFFFAIIFYAFGVKLNAVGTSHNQDLVVNHVHVAKVHVGHLLLKDVSGIIGVHVNTLALSEEGVELLIELTVE